MAAIQATPLEELLDSIGFEDVDLRDIVTDGDEVNGLIAETDFDALKAAVVSNPVIFNDSEINYQSVVVRKRCITDEHWCNYEILLRPNPFGTSFRVTLVTAEYYSPEGLYLPVPSFALMTEIKKVMAGV